MIATAHASKSQTVKSSHWSIKALSCKFAPYNLLSALAAKNRIIVLELVKLPSGVYSKGKVGMVERSLRSANVSLGKSVTLLFNAVITLFIFLYLYWIGKSVQ